MNYTQLTCFWLDCTLPLKSVLSLTLRLTAVYCLIITRISWAKYLSAKGQVRQLIPAKLKVARTVKHSVEAIVDKGRSILS